VTVQDSGRPYDAASGVDVFRAACRRHQLECGHRLFAADRPLWIARAPGRLDVMGGIADYSGSLVLQWPIAEATFAAVQPVADPAIHVVSLGSGAPREVRVPLEIMAPGRGGDPYSSARAWFAADPQRHWAAYAAGAWAVLASERGVSPTGARVLVASAVPEGKGVSSSAALEAAVMRGLVASLDLAIGGRELALLCQTVENRVVGAACGVMDQMTSLCGEAYGLLALLCQPAELMGSVRLPASLAVWGIDSGIRHAVSGSDYASVRVGAFMGYRIVADRAHLPARSIGKGRVTVDDPRWRGYLANVTPEEFVRFEPALPERIDGRTFLDRYGGTTDPITTIEPDRVYAVRQAARHPVFEHARVQRWRAVMADAGGRPIDASAATALGADMYASHDSYSACGLGSEGTDRLVALARAAGPDRGIYGAKITGGGSGGTVAVLTRADAAGAIDEIAAAYARETGYPAQVFSGSSPGAMHWTPIVLREDLGPG
jgi:L-arabinokinase